MFIGSATTKEFIQFLLKSIVSIIDSFTRTTSEQVLPSSTTSALQMSVTIHLRLAAKIHSQWVALRSGGGGDSEEESKKTSNNS